MVATVTHILKFIHLFIVPPRINRITYLSSIWLNLFALIALILPLALLSPNSELFVLSIILLCFIFGSNILLLKVKRLQDMNLSGWLCILFGIPLINFVLALLLLTYPGTKTANKYGDIPDKAPKLKYAIALITTGILFLVFILGLVFSFVFSS